MKYSKLAAALVLALGGAAAADNGPSAQTNKTTGTAKTDVNALPEQASQIEAVDLLFDTDSATLKPGARDELVSAAQWAKCNSKGLLILEGHADPRGSQDHNMRLSADRAAVVRQRLINMGVPSDHIVITVYGENGPKRSTFAEDRRVTVRAGTRPLNPEEVTASR